MPCLHVTGLPTPALRSEATSRLPWPTGSAPATSGPRPGDATVMVAREPATVAEAVRRPIAG